MSRFLAINFLLILVLSAHAQKADRKALVLRHNIVVTKADSSSPITLGNGRFAFTTDVTGLQTFPVNYGNGVPLATQSEWGWKNYVDTTAYKIDEALQTYQLNGRYGWLPQNPHRLQLGNIGFEITKKDGRLATISDVQTIYQELNLWTGKLRSHFTIEGVPVEVATYCSGTDDAVGVKVRSPLIAEGRLKIRLVFPGAAGNWTGEGSKYSSEDKQDSKILMSHDNGAVVLHRLDSAKYYVGFKWEGSGFIEQKDSHYFLIAPDTKTDLFDLTAKFTAKKDLAMLPSFIDVRMSSENLWKKFWSANRAIDFSENAGKKGFEAERRVVLTQHSLKTRERLQEMQ